MIMGVMNMNRLNDFALEKALEEIQLRDPHREKFDKGGTRCISVPFMPCFLFIHLPEHIQHVMHKKFARYVKGKQWQAIAYPVFQRGWLVTDGSDWQISRKIIVNIFKSTGFRQQVAVTSRNNLQQMVLDKLGEAADTKTVLDMQELLHNLTMTTFLQVAVCPDLFGIDVPTFAHAFDEANHTIDLKFLMQPVYPLMELFTGKWGRFKRLGQYMRSTIKTIVDRERKELALEEQQPADQAAAASKPFNFVRQLLAASYPDGSPLTEADIVDNVLQTILAAKDTTAIAVSWSLYEMMMHPDIEAKLLAEAKQILVDEEDGPFYKQQQESSSSQFSRLWEDIPKLKYLKAVFMETLRLHPPIPLEAKFAREDDVLPDGTFVPKGTAVMFCTYAINRLLPMWGKDAFDYRPERWMEFSTQPTQYEFPVFNAGPRLCAGKDIAEVQGPFLLLEILRRYKLHLVPGQQIVPQQSLVLPMRYGMKVTVTRRTAQEGGF